MNPLFKKLNFKAHTPIFVGAAPESFEPVLQEMAPLTRIDREVAGETRYPFLLQFVSSEAALEAAAKLLQGHIADDAVLWFAYPKKSSKRYQSDITRDQGWAALGAMGYEPVRQVAIDEDWSALRFRLAENIQTMRRDPSWALSEQGKEKAGK